MRGEYADAFGYGDPEDDEWYYDEAEIMDDEIVMCPNCGAEQLIDQIYCEDCGESLEEE